jgi:hypothetical protein
LPSAFRRGAFSGPACSGPLLETSVNQETQIRTGGEPNVPNDPSRSDLPYLARPARFTDDEPRGPSDLADAIEPCGACVTHPGRRPLGYTSHTTMWVGPPTPSRAIPPRKGRGRAGGRARGSRGREAAGAPASRQGSRAAIPFHAGASGVPRTCFGGRSAPLYDRCSFKELGRIVPHEWGDAAPASAPQVGGNGSALREDTTDSVIFSVVTRSKTSVRLSVFV